MKQQQQFIIYLDKALKILEKLSDKDCTSDSLIRSELEYLKGYLQGGIEILNKSNSQE